MGSLPHTSNPPVFQSCKQKKGFRVRSTKVVVLLLWQVIPLFRRLDAVEAIFCRDIKRLARFTASEGDIGRFIRCFDVRQFLAFRRV
ncbi:MAG: hypothetical protein MJE68_17105, partial [Proteobacteria bacterium]|nr:hypothetical protein [Pseudomonadota bacterium]